MPAGKLCEMAIRTASYAMDFFQAMVVHIDDEINMLPSFGLDSKQIMLLVSNQVVQICDNFFEFRQHASNVDPSNRTATAARFAWVTLQALEDGWVYAQQIQASYWNYRHIYVLPHEANGANIRRRTEYQAKGDGN